MNNNPLLLCEIKHPSPRFFLVQHQRVIASWENVEARFVEGLLGTLGFTVVHVDATEAINGMIEYLEALNFGEEGEEEYNEEGLIHVIIKYLGESRLEAPLSEQEKAWLMGSSRDFYDFYSTALP